MKCYLVTYVESEDDGQHASGRVATVMLCPTIINILKEHRVYHQNLKIKIIFNCLEEMYEHVNEL